MVWIYKFNKDKEFYQNLLNFIRDLHDRYQMGHIRFFPEHGRELFTDVQLKHVAPHWNLQDSQGFLYEWNRRQDVVRIVSFDLFNESGSPKVKVEIDLNQKRISLEEVSGITSQDVLMSLKNFFILNDLPKFTVNIWWKYTHPVWWILIALLFIFRDGVWALMKLAWKHKLISGILLVIIIPIIVGLCVNYLTWKFGWK